MLKMSREEKEREKVDKAHTELIDKIMRDLDIEIETASMTLQEKKEELRKLRAWNRERRGKNKR